MADRTYEELVEQYERICTRMPQTFDLIGTDLSAEALRLGVELLLDLSVCESALHEAELAQLQDRVKRIEDSLGLSPLLPSSGGAARRVRLE